MKRTMISAASAAALSLALLGGTPVSAQGTNDAVASGLAAIGVQAPNPDMLSAEQVGQLQNVLSSTDTDEVKRGRIQQILGNEATATGRIGVAQLRSSVELDLADIGVDASGVDMLTVGQLAEIENVMSGGDTQDVKRGRVQEIMGNEATATGRLGVAQLQDSVASDLASLGVDADGVEMLTLSQLGQIENVMGSSDTDENKRGQIERIMAN